MFRIWGKEILYIEYNGGILSKGILSGGELVLGGILSGGLSGGFCPRTLLLHQDKEVCDL